MGSSFDNEAEPYGSAKLQLEENPLEDQALMQELEKVDGIEKITAFDSVYMTATFSGGSGSITSISDFFPTLNREQTEEKQAVLSSGTADYDDMVEKNGILVAKYKTASEAHQLHGFHIGGIYECIRKPTRTLKGFHWRWLSDWEASYQ